MAEVGNVSGKQIGNLDLANMDIETMFMSLTTERANVLDATIAERASQMQDRNKQIADINSKVMTLRNDMKGMDKKKTAYKNAELQLQNYQTEIDTLSSNSQLDMIGLQGLINKRNQAVEMLTNLVQKFAKTTDSIVGNMR
ncbi:MAG TPA: hypothetical protein VFG43_02465 [Geminicoccaceae bacterium]|nr:hypothetical protein [Geminicoccaceae bacterium]